MIASWCYRSNASRQTVLSEARVSNVKGGSCSVLERTNDIMPVCSDLSSIRPREALRTHIAMSLLLIISQLLLPVRQSCAARQTDCACVRASRSMSGVCWSTPRARSRSELTAMRCSKTSRSATSVLISALASAMR